MNPDTILQYVKTDASEQLFAPESDLSFNFDHYNQIVVIHFDKKTDFINRMDIFIFMICKYIYIVDF